MNWPFDQSEDTVAITTKYVIELNYPILSVVHYEDDETWGFFCRTTDDEEDGRVISMKEAIDLDNSLFEIADLRPGWNATRENVNSKWIKNKIIE